VKYTIRSNEVRLWLSVLVKTGGRLVRHARYYWLLQKTPTGRTMNLWGDPIMEIPGHRFLEET